MQKNVLHNHTVAATLWITNCHLKISQVKQIRVHSKKGSECPVSADENVVVVPGFTVWRRDRNAEGIEGKAEQGHL